MRSVGMQPGPLSKEVIKFPDGSQLNLRSTINRLGNRAKGLGVGGAPSEEDDRVLQRFHKRGPPMTAAKDHEPVGCGECKNPAASMVCQRCKCALFCDSVCQARAWPQHKLICEAPEDLFAKYDREQEEMEKEERNSKSNSKHEGEAAATERDLAAMLEDFFNRGTSKQVTSSRPEEPHQEAPELDKEAAQEELCTVMTLNGVVGTGSLPCGGYVSIQNQGESGDMPRVLLGTGGFDGLHGKAGRAAMLAALKMGYRGIDTSEMNRNLIDIQWAWTRSGVDRKDLFFVMKIPPWSHGSAEVKKSFRRQSRLLGLDYVDLLLLQWPHVWSWDQKEWGPAEWSKANQRKASLRRETWAAMEELYNSGLARAIGVSNHTIDDMEALLQCCDVPPMVLQGESHPHWPNRPVRDWCRKHDIIFQGYAPFGGQETEQNSGHRAVDDETIQAVATRNGLSPFEVCMQWNQARNSSTVVKSQNLSHLRENLTACQEMRCSAADLGRIDERAKSFLKYGPCYWGHNDMDYMHPWKDEQKMMEAMFSEGGREGSRRFRVPEAQKTLSGSHFVSGS